MVGGIKFNSASVTTNETWEFDPIANTWTQKANYPHAVGQAAAFTLNNFGYVFGGNSTDPIVYYNDLNKYDPLTNSWTAAASLPADARSGVAAFAVNGKGYAGLGFAAASAAYADWWEYTDDGCNIPTPWISSNLMEFSTLAGQGTYQWYYNNTPIAGATNNTYNVTQSGDYYVMVTDSNGCTAQSDVFNVIINGIESVDVNDAIQVYPNPSTDFITVTLSSNNDVVHVINSLGQIVLTREINSRNALVDISQLPNGVYYVRSERLQQSTLLIKQ